MTQYDVEIYQRIEHMLGQKLEAFQAPQDEVLLLMERVGEAQRYAAMEMRTNEHKKKGGGEGKRGAASEDSGGDPELQKIMAQASRGKKARR